MCGGGDNRKKPDRIFDESKYINILWKTRLSSHINVFKVKVMYKLLKKIKPTVVES